MKNVLLISLLFLINNVYSQSDQNAYIEPAYSSVDTANNNYAEIVELLKQGGWQWADLGKQQLAANQIQLYAINAAVSADLLAQKITAQFKHILQQVQYTKGIYVLGGLYKKQHMLVQVYPVNKSAARAYISILGQINNNADYLHKLLPLDRQNLVSFDAAGTNKFALLRVNMPLADLYFYIQQQLGRNLPEQAEYMDIKNKIKTKAYFSINVDKKPYGEIQIFATAKTNKSLLTIVYPAGGKP